MEVMTVVKLRQLSKDLGIKGGYLLHKGELIKTIKTHIKLNLKEMTVSELKQYCKDKGISGYSKLNKPELLKLIKLSCN